MAFIFYLNIYIFPMILLVSIFVSLRTSSVQSFANRIFRNLLSLTFLLLFSELTTWLFDGSTMSNARYIILFINILYFTLSPIVSLYWLNFVCFHLHNKTLGLIMPLKKIVLFAPVVIYLFILYTSPMIGWIFTISVQNHYVRGPIYFLPYVCSSLYLVFAFLLLMASYKKSTLRLGIYTLLPVFASVIQAAFNAIWISLPTAALAELLIYIQIQNQQITTDILTKLNNRGCLDLYMENLLTQRGTTQISYLFMMDLDHFKSINDTLGHTTGDLALIQTARILSKFFEKSNGFIARYGGDEFCAVIPCPDDLSAQLYIYELQKAFETANQISTNPFQLSVSIGFSRIDPSASTSYEELVRRADEMMYIDKRRQR